MTSLWGSVWVIGKPSAWKNYLQKVYVSMYMHVGVSRCVYVLCVIHVCVGMYMYNVFMQDQKIALIVVL